MALCKRLHSLQSVGRRQVEHGVYCVHLQLCSSFHPSTSLLGVDDDVMPTGVLKHHQDACEVWRMSCRVVECMVCMCYLRMCVVRLPQCLHLVKK